MEAVSPSVAVTGTTAAKAALLVTPMLLKTQVGRDRYHFSVGRNGFLDGPYKSASDALGSVIEYEREIRIGVPYLRRDKLYLCRDQIEALRSHPKAIRATFLHDIKFTMDYEIRLWAVELDSLTSIFLFQETLLYQQTHLRPATLNFEHVSRPLTLYGYYKTIESLRNSANDYAKQITAYRKEKIEKYRIYNLLKQTNMTSTLHQTTSSATSDPLANVEHLHDGSDNQAVKIASSVSDNFVPKKIVRTDLESEVGLERAKQDYINHTESMLAGIRADADDALCFISEQAVTLIPETNVQVLNNTVAIWYLLLGKAKSWFYRTTSGNLSGPWVDLTSTVKYVQQEDYSHSESSWSTAKWASFTQSKVLPVTDEKCDFVAWCVSIADLKPFYIFSRYNRAIPVLIINNEEEINLELEGLRAVPTYRPGWRAWGSTSPILE